MLLFAKNVITGQIKVAKFQAGGIELQNGKWDLNHHFVQNWIDYETGLNIKYCVSWRRD